MNIAGQYLKNLDEQPEEVKLCVYSLINTLDSYSSYNDSDKGVNSESIDGYSVSYTSADKKINEAKPLFMRIEKTL